MSVFVNILAQTDHPAQATAATDETFEIGEMQFDATITEVSLIPNAAQAAVDTTYRTLTVQNRGQDGTGTTVIATLDTQTAATGGAPSGPFVANDERLFALTATLANRNVAANDVLACVETHASTGAAHPAFTLTVKGTRR